MPRSLVNSSTNKLKNLKTHKLKRMKIQQITIAALAALVLFTGYLLRLNIGLA